VEGVSSPTYPVLQEQFSAEWDYIPLGRGPLSLAQPWSVGGKYFWTSNLFQIGLVSRPPVASHLGEVT
jgi:hypothetical protein